MKKILFTLFAFTALVFSSCNKNEFVPTDNSASAEIFAVIENDGTKTTVDNNDILWAKGDKISVLNTSNTFDTYTLATGGEGSKSAKFTADATPGTAAGKAVYPAGAHSYNGTALTVNLPVSYGDVSTEYTPNTNVLMLGTATGTYYEFKHLGGVVAIPVAAPIGTQSVSLTASGIAGDFTVVNEGGVDLIKKADDAEEATVTYTFAPLAKATESVFYFPLPTGNYKEFKVVLKNASDAVILQKKIQNFSVASKAIGRAQIVTFPKLTTEISEGFEYGSGPFGVLWGGTMTVVDTEAKSGTKSLELSNSAAGNMWDAQCAITFNYPLDQNKMYRVSFYHKSDVEGATAQFQYQYSKSNGSVQGGYADVVTSTDWQYFETTFIPNAATIDRIIINFGKTVANYYIDDFCFCEVDLSENLVADGGLENGTTGLGVWGKYNVASVAGYEGQCLEFTLTDECVYGYQAQIFWPVSGLEAGKTYTYSFYAKSDYAPTAQLVVQDESSGQQYAGWHPITSDWARYTGEFTCDPSKLTDATKVTRVGIQFGIDAATGGEKFWIDNFVFSEKK